MFSKDAVFRVFFVIILHNVTIFVTQYFRSSYKMQILKLNDYIFLKKNYKLYPKNIQTQKINLKHL